MTLAEGFDGFLVDLDGVMWRGDLPVPGAAEAIDALRSANKRVIFVTNNASRSARDYAAKLMRMHVPTPPGDIVTSAHAVVAHLRGLGLERGSRIHVFGTAALGQLLRTAGFTTTKDTVSVDALVVAWNPRLSFDDLRRASDVARAGVPFIGANRDATYPAEDGLLPGTGAILAAIETASGREAMVVGKPAPYLFALALERSGSDPQRTLVIGDRPESDVAGAHAAGLPAALVLTGVTRPAAVGSIVDAPEWVLRELGDVLREGPAGNRTSGGVRPRVRDVPALRTAPSEGDDQDQSRDEAADVREIRDPALGGGLSETADPAEELQDEPETDHHPGR